MRAIATTTAVAGLALSLLVATAADAATPRHVRPVRHDASREACIRHKTNRGTAIGAGAGAVAGYVLGGPVGGKLGGTVIGAGAGAVVGHQIAKHAARRGC